jgi:hypothetical protein
VFDSEGANGVPTEMALVTKSPLVELGLSTYHKMYEYHLRAWSSNDPRLDLRICNHHVQRNKNTQVFGSEGATERPTEMAFVTKSPVEFGLSISRRERKPTPCLFQR